MFDAVRPTTEEVRRALPGDDLVDADVVMDRAFTLTAAPADVWPWLVQLGKKRAGWYFPRSVERFIPPARRGLRILDPEHQHLEVGDVIPDYGGRDETFTVAEIVPPTTLVYRSQRGDVQVSWAIVLAGISDGPATRLHLRLRLGSVRRPWLAESVGGLFDLLTIAGLAAGLRERVGRGRLSAR